MGVSRAAVLVLVSLLWVGQSVGCADKSTELEATGRRLAAGDERDATVPVREPGWGISLASPLPGYKLMDAGAAHALASGAVLGAVGPDGVSAVIVPRPALGATLDELAARRAALLGGERVELRNITVGEVAGRAFAFSAAGLRRAGAVWLRHGFAFELRVWGVGAAVDQALDAVLGALASFEREGEPPALPPVDQRGADWRVAGGVYENAASGLRLEAPVGTRLVVGAELAVDQPLADVALVGQSAPLSLTVASEPATGPGTRPWFTTEMAAAVGGELGEPLEVTVLGTRRSLSRRHVGGQVVLLGDLCDLARCHGVVLRYEPSAEALALAALSGLTTLAAPAQKALDEELSAAPRLDCALGDGWSLRAGRYTSFEHGFSLAVPPVWDVVVPPAASARVAGASLVLEARRFGLTAAVLVDSTPLDDDAAYHAAVVRGLGERGGLKAGPPVREGEGWVSRGAGAGGLSWVVATRGAGEGGVQLSLWGPTSRVDAHPEPVAALLAGLSRSVDKATESPPGGYLDRRLGISASMPVGWRVAVQTPPELEPHGALVTWDRDGRFVGLLAQCLPHGTDGAWSLRYAEQRLRRRLGGLARGAAVERQVPVAGHEARGVHWEAPLEHVDVVVSRRGNLLLAWAAADGRGEALDQALKGFEFID